MLPSLLPQRDVYYSSPSVGLSSPLPLHFAGSAVLADSGDSSVFTSRTRYARLTRRLQQLEAEIECSTAAETENERMRTLHARGAVGNTTGSPHSHSHFLYQQHSLALKDGSSEPSLDAPTVDVLLSALLPWSSHPRSVDASSHTHYTGEALLHAMARLTQRDSKDDKDATGAVKRQQPQPPALQQQTGQTGPLSPLGRATLQVQQTAPLQQHLPIVSGTTTLPPVASSGAAAVTTGSAPVAGVAASRSVPSSESDVWSVGQSAQLSVRAVLDYYRSHPSARSELQSRVEALRTAKVAAASGAVNANKRSMGQRHTRQERTERSREAERSRQRAVRQRLKRAAAEVAEAMEAAQTDGSSTAVRGRTQQSSGTAGSGRLLDASEDGSGGGGASGTALLEAISGEWDDGSGDAASVDRRARSLWLNIALPTATSCTLWLERTKTVLIPRLCVELDSDVDVLLSGLFHSSLVARLQDSKDAALTVLKRSLASYGQRWQEKRRRKAATLILRFLTLVHTASAIRQALRDTSVLTHILRIQRWWRRHTSVLHAQCTVVSKKWRRREAAMARQQSHSSSHSQGPTTPSAAGGGAGTGGAGVAGAGAGQADHHREAASRDRRRQASFDARITRHRGGVDQLQQRDVTGGGSGGVSGASSGGGGVSVQPLSVSLGDASAYKAIPRSAQQQAVSHLLAVRRAVHRRRLRLYFAQLAHYQSHYAQQLELITTRRMLGMEGSEPSSGTAVVGDSGSSTSTAHSHTLTLPPAPVRPVFPLVPQNAEMDRLLIAASRSYYLSRLVGFRLDGSGATPSSTFAAPHREAASDEVDFAPAFCTPHSPTSNSNTHSTAPPTASSNELSRVREESDSTPRPVSSQLE